MKLLVTLFALATLGMAQNTPVFPTRPATTSDLMIASNRADTTLTQNVLVGDLTLNVAATAGFAVPGLVTIDSEIIKACSKTSNTFTVCASGRGFDGSAAAGHLTTIHVTGRMDAWHHNQMAAETAAIETKLHNEVISAVDKGADVTGVIDATAAIQACINAAGPTGCFLPGGLYKISNPSGFGSLILTSSQRLFGSGPNQSILLQSTNGGTSVVVAGNDVVIQQLMIAKAAGVTGGTALSLYPDVTSSIQVANTRIENVSVTAAYCNNDPSCGSTANSNRLTYGVLAQSGVKDNLFNHFKSLYCRWATECVYLLSGGLAGSGGGGAVNANDFTGSFFSDTTDCVKLGASGENFFLASQCTNASHAEFTFASGTGGTYGSAASSANLIHSMGESSAAVADFGSVANANTIVRQGNEDSAGITGNIVILGSAQNLNQVLAPGIFKTGFYNVSGANKSVDPYLCAGLTDDLAQPCTATVDFRSSLNVLNIFRYRNKSNSGVGADYVNWNPFSGGFRFQSDATYPISSPVANFNHDNPSAVLAYINLQTQRTDMGGFGSRYYNSSVSAIRTSTLYTYDGSGTQVFPLWARGDGPVGPGIEMTVAGKPACNASLPPAGTLQQEIAVSDLLTPALGSAPTGGGAVHGKLHCNGSAWTVSAI